MTTLTLLLLLAWNSAGEPRPGGTVKPSGNAVEVSLDALPGLCRKMLDGQTTVQRETRELHRRITATADQKLRPQERQAAQRLAVLTKVTAKYVTRAIQLLEAEGSAVAFPEVFRQVREDLVNIELRLRSGDVGNITLTIQQDVVETLQEMVSALKKR